MLQKRLQESDSFTTLSKPEQHIFLVLARHFEENYDYLYLSPKELHESTDIATPEQWQKFLKLSEVEQYIKNQMSFLAQVSQRKTFRSLVQSALEGNTQAARQVQEISGIYNKQDDNKVVVLTYVPRSTTN